MIRMVQQLSVAVGMAALLCALASGALANNIGKPTGAVILTISGAIANTNNNGRAEFDLEMLKGLPSKTFKTSTTWTEGVSSFTGVSMQELLTAVGAQGSVAKSIALNDYAVEIPTTDAVADGPIVAYAVDEKAMSIRDKGPLWIIYPFDTKSEYRTESTFAKSIWQLSRIEVRK